MISLRDVVTGFGNRDPVAEVWRRNLRGGGGGGGGAAVITGSLPLRYIGNGTPLSDYLISGNTVQDGTPSSEAPVDAVGCGVWDETRQSYKLPPTVNGTEYPIYLGFTDSTRRIRKLVLTGDEEWTYITGGKHWTAVSGYLKSGLMCICSHYKAVENGSGSSFITNGQVGFYSSLADRLIFCDTTCTTTDDWKSYLAQQYATGTPVTIWYVLATPETAVVNESLMKIGDYADTISFAQSGVTIPTVNVANVLDMTSPVKPSEVYIKGKGIKPTGYGQLVDKNGVRILDKNDVRILVHGQ